MNLEMPGAQSLTLRADDMMSIDIMAAMSDVVSVMGQHTSSNLHPGPKSLVRIPYRMLVFRNGKWLDVPVNVSDPIFTEGHMREMATIIASRVESSSYASALAEAEKVLYERLYSLGNNMAAQSTKKKSAV